jgi:hypothetical protein
MASLPLAGLPRGDDAGHMDFSTITRIARRVRAVVNEMNYASTRATALMLNGDLEQPGRVPDTYAEFLLRTSATTVHEPPARCR